MIDTIIKGLVVLIKETGWKPEYLIWELPCAYSMMIMNYWPVVKKPKNSAVDELDYENAEPAPLGDIMRLQLQGLD